MTNVIGGTGSCVGDSVCAEIVDLSSFMVSDDACVGDTVCQDLTAADGSIGKDSCVGGTSCDTSTDAFSVGIKSCVEETLTNV